MTSALPDHVEKAMYTYTTDVDRHARKDENQTSDRKEWFDCSERSRDALIAAIHRALDERAIDALDNDEAAAISRPSADESGGYNPLSQRLVAIADEVERAGWDEAAGELRAGARRIDTAYVALDCGATVLASQNVRPSNLKTAHDAVEQIRALLPQDGRGGKT